MTTGWRVELDGVALSGSDAPGVGALTVPPDGLGLPGLRTEDVTYPQRDGVRHFDDWYEPRIITLTDVVVHRSGCCNCPELRQQVRSILRAWSRRCDDVELVIWPDCESPAWDADKEIVGPFGIVGRPRVAEVEWSRSNEGTATLLLRFDAVDHRIYLLDRDGTPGSGVECVTLTPESRELVRCYPRCYTGGGGGGQETALRTNLHPNPFVGGDGWSATGPEDVMVTVETEGGPTLLGRSVPWLRAEVDEANTGVDVTTTTNDPALLPLTGGPVPVSVYVYGAGVNLFLGLATDAGTVWSAEPFNPGEGWTQIADTLTPPEGAAQGSLVVRADGETIIDPVVLGVTGALVGVEGEPFDGDNPARAGLRYDWSGDPYASSSQEIEEGETSGGDDTYCYDTTQGNSEGGPVTFTVRGDTCVSPTITLYGPLTSPIVENIATGETVGYAGTIADSDPPVVIDTEDGTAIQGGQSRTHLLTGDARLLLESGENTLRLISYQSTDSGHAEVCWRPVVLSI